MTSTEERHVNGACRSDAGAPSAHAERTGGPPADGLSALRRQEFRTAIPETASRFFDTAYAPGWRLTELKPGSEIFHRRAEANALVLDEIQMQGRANCAVNPGNRVIVIQPRAGTVCFSGDEQRSNSEEPVLCAPGLRGVLELSDAHFDVVSIDASMLRAAAADLPVPLPAEIRFLHHRPASADDSQAWRRTLDYVSATFGTASAVNQPLIVAAAVRMVAATLLECFPSTLDRRSGSGGSDQPPSLNRAVAFIHRMAMDDIGINEIAESVHLTPRAVQYLFRRQLDTTPTEYLRQVRLHRAHQDLVAADRTVTTVGAIAAKWGFSHTGRFAVLYRQTYGQSPHATLRD